MQYIYNYDSFLNEGLFSNRKNVYDNIHSDLSTQFYFLTTFNASILGLYPIVEKLLFNSTLNLNLPPYQIALLTVFAVAEFHHNYSEDYSETLKEMLKEEGIYKYNTLVKQLLLAVKVLFTKVAKSVGKTIDKFVDMLGFVALIVPFNNILWNLTTENNMDYTTLIKITLMGVATSIGIFSLKNIVKEIISNLKKYFRKNESMNFEDEFDWDEEDENNIDFNHTPQFEKGQIFIRDIYGKELYVFVKDNNDFGPSVFHIGSLDHNYDRTRYYASLIFNTNDYQIVRIKRDFKYRLPTEKERSIIQMSLNIYFYQRYIKIAEKEVGTKIYV